MKNVNLCIVAGLALTIGNQAHAFMPQVGVYGPEGSRIAYERKGDVIIIREFEKLTNKEEIEKAERVVRTMELPVSVFKDLVKQKLATLDKAPLSADQTKLLERYLTEIPNLEAEQKKLAELGKNLQRIETAQKEEGDTDYLKGMKAATETDIQCIKDRLAGQSEIIDAKNQLATIVDKLIEDMDGASLKKTLKHQDDKGGIAFNLLREIVATSKCSDLAGKDLKPGTTCITSQGIVLVRVSEPEAGWKVASSNGKTWFDAAKSPVNHAEAKEFCNKPGLALPSKEDFEAFRTYFERNKDGYFTDAGRKELYALFPNMESKWFWSDTLHPSNSDNAFEFNGNVGIIVNDNRDSRNFYNAVRCVSVPSVKR